MQSLRDKPELPDIVVYVETLESPIRGARLERVRVAGPFLLRTVNPPISDAEGRAVRELRRMEKRIARGSYPTCEPIG